MTEPVDLLNDDRVDVADPEPTSRRAARRARRGEQRAEARERRIERRRQLLNQDARASSFAPVAVVFLVAVLGVGAWTHFQNSPTNPATPTMQPSDTPTAVPEDLPVAESVDLSDPRAVLGAWTDAYFALDPAWEELTVPGSVPLLQQQRTDMLVQDDSPLKGLEQVAVADSTIRPTEGRTDTDTVFPRTIDVLLDVPGAAAVVYTLDATAHLDSGGWKIDTATVTAVAEA